MIVFLRSSKRGYREERGQEISDETDSTIKIRNLNPFSIRPGGQEDGPSGISG
jgi:hypothetical protein